MKFTKLSSSVTLIALVLSAVITACASTVIGQKMPTAGAAPTRLQVAEAIFQERCKRAGEKIDETVDNVEGVFLMKLRPKSLNYGDQFLMDDPYGSDYAGDAYIGSFLRGHYEAGHSGTPVAGSPATPLGYSFVEAIDPTDGKRYRYTGSIRSVGRKKIDAPNVQFEIKRDPNYDLNIYAFVIDKTPAEGKMPRYGVTYDDISTKEERAYWIAGSALKIVDLDANKVIAERIGYLMDRGQGDNSGGRAPWLIAANNACPSFVQGYTVVRSGHASLSQIGQAERFVEKVLKPKSGK